MMMQYSIFEYDFIFSESNRMVSILFNVVDSSISISWTLKVLIMFPGFWWTLFHMASAHLVNFTTNSIPLVRITFCNQGLFVSQTCSTMFAIMSNLLVSVTSLISKHLVIGSTTTTVCDCKGSFLEFLRLYKIQLYLHLCILIVWLLVPLEEGNQTSYVCFG